MRKSHSRGTKENSFGSISWFLAINEFDIKLLRNQCSVRVCLWPIDVLASLLYGINPPCRKTIMSLNSGDKIHETPIQNNFTALPQNSFNSIFTAIR